MAPWPLVGRAQQKKAMPVIGMLSTGAPDRWGTFLVAFRQGLSEGGFVEGVNVAIEYRWADGDYDRLPSLAADLVARKVDLIVAGSPPTALAAKAATSTIPIVFRGGADPVADGLVATLARPGGNLTGVATAAADDLAGKRLELLAELVPRARVIVLLVNPSLPAADRVVHSVQDAARVGGLQLHVLKAHTDSEIEAAFVALDELHAGALVVSADPYLSSRRGQLVALAARHAIPAMYSWREFAAAGGLVSYGASLTVAFRLVGEYAAKVLKGARPADLPVQQPRTLELVINLRTAKALGLAVPRSLVVRADEVIE